MDGGGDGAGDGWGDGADCNRWAGTGTPGNRWAGTGRGLERDCLDDSDERGS